MKYLINLITAWILASFSAHAQSITGLGTLPGASGSSGIEMSADGLTVVGKSMGRAFRWDQATGMQDLGSNFGASILSVATGVSEDGTYIVGIAGSDGITTFQDIIPMGFRWSASSGMEYLGFSSASNFQSAAQINPHGYLSVDGSGTRIAGAFNDGGAWLWTQGEGMHQISGFSFPSGLSNNGNYVSGQIFISPHDRASRWAELGGAIDLGAFEQGYYREFSYSSGISGNGQVVIGQSYAEVAPNQDGYRAFRWSATEGLVDLGTLAGDLQSRAFGTNHDGSIVVGASYDSMLGMRGFIWSDSLGMMDFGVYLQSVGIGIEGWEIHEIKKISDDGTTIMGEGTFEGVRQAFVVNVPEPSSLSLLLAGGAVLMAGRRRKRD